MTATGVPRLIAVDFDSTICEFAYPGIGKPKDGVREALQQLRSAGYHIMIWSCRCCKWYPEIFNPTNEPLDRNRPVIRDMIAWLAEHDIPYDSIDYGDKGKPMADYYIDDKAIRFEDNWSEISDVITRRTKG